MATVVTPLNDINSLYNVSSNAIKNSLVSGLENEDNGKNVFSTFFDAAVNNITETNNYLSDEENEELKLAMGISENTHDLSIAIQKAETALSYTIALRDKLLSAYQEIMQIQM